MIRVSRVICWSSSRSDSRARRRRDARRRSGRCRPALRCPRIAWFGCMAAHRLPLALVEAARLSGCRWHAQLPSRGARRPIQPSAAGGGMPIASPIFSRSWRPGQWPAVNGLDRSPAKLLDCRLIVIDRDRLHAGSSSSAGYDHRRGQARPESLRRDPFKGGAQVRSTSYPTAAISSIAASWPALA